MAEPMTLSRLQSRRTAVSTVTMRRAGACPTSIDVPRFIRRIATRRPRRQRAHDPRGEPDGRELRPRLPDRRTLRGRVRLRAAIIADSHRRPAALRDGLADAHDGRRYSSPAQRPEDASRWSAAGRPGSPPRATRASWATPSRYSSADELPAVSNTYGIVPFRLAHRRRAVGSAASRATRASRSNRTRRSAPTSRPDRCCADYDAVVIACRHGRRAEARHSR